MSQVPPGIRRGRLDDAEIDEILRLHGQGFTPGRIAQKLNRHPVTVGYAMHRLGCRKLTLRTFEYVRKGVTVRSFSREEDALLTELRVAGLSTPKIAAALTERFGHRRSAHTVNVRLVLLSNLETEAEAA